jgi:outer membrane protein assembly factor BamB
LGNGGDWLCVGRGVAVAKLDRERGGSPGRERRVLLVVIAALVVVALSVAVAVVVDRGADDDPARRRRVGGQAVSEEPVLRWRTDGLVGSIPAGQRMLAANAKHVFVASGFADAHVVHALDRATGEIRWTSVRPSTTFLQGLIGGVLVASGQYDTVTGLAVDTGAERWTIDLRAIDLAGYGADVSAVIGDLMVVGLSSHGEGDTRPPVVVGVDGLEGTVRWRAVLETGTDLMWGEPLIADGAAVFLSMPSNPTSAPSNVAHAVNVGDGSVRWTFPLGGGQGFRLVAPVASAGRVHLPAQREVVTVDVATGTELWRRPSMMPVPLLRGDELVVLEDGQLVVIDAASGEARSNRALSPLSQPPDYVLAPFDSEAVLLFDREQARAVVLDDGTPRWLLRWPSSPIAVPTIDEELLLVAADDGTVSAYDLPPP